MKILQPNLTNSLTNLKYFIDDSITKLDEVIRLKNFFNKFKFKLFF